MFVNVRINTGQKGYSTVAEKFKGFVKERIVSYLQIAKC
jgi:hypothetical protein